MCLELYDILLFILKIKERILLWHYLLKYSDKKFNDGH